MSKDFDPKNSNPDGENQSGKSRIQKSEDENRAETLFYAQKDARLTYQLAAINFEMYAGNPKRFDPETGYVFFDESTHTEDMPINDDDKNNPELVEAWDNRDTEIIIETTEWLRVNPDGTINIKINSERYDQGGVTHTFTLEDISTALPDLMQREDARKALEHEDPFEAAMQDADRNQDKVVLSETMTEFTITPNEVDGSFTIESTETHTDFTTKDSEPTVVTTKFESTQPDFPESSIARQFFSLRFNMFNSIIDLLGSVVSKEAPARFAKIFTPEVKKQIMKMIRSEIKELAKAGRLQEDITYFKVKPGSYFYSADRIMQTINFFYQTIKTDMDANQITIEETSIALDLEGSIFEEAFEDEGLPVSGYVLRNDENFYQLGDVTQELREVYDTYEQRMIKRIGKVAYRQRLKSHFEELRAKLAADVPVNADGQIAKGYVSLDGDYSGSITTLNMRPTAFYNRTGVHIFEETLSDGNDPNPAELELLMKLII